ncbi:MAG: hypothetical protein H6707_08140 [Deltaproteobacteria bacterium]|nr:hypothetical protein [Deltaproteobacteria bacterium]
MTIPWLSRRVPLRGVRVLDVRTTGNKHNVLIKVTPRSSQALAYNKQLSLDRGERLLLWDKDGNGGELVYLYADHKGGAQLQTRRRRIDEKPLLAKPAGAVQIADVQRLENGAFCLTLASTQTDGQRQASTGLVLKPGPEQLLALNTSSPSDRTYVSVDRRGRVRLREFIGAGWHWLGKKPYVVDSTVFAKPEPSRDGSYLTVTGWLKAAIEPGDYQIDGSWRHAPRPLLKRKRSQGKPLHWRGDALVGEPSTGLRIWLPGARLTAQLVESQTLGFKARVKADGLSIVRLGEVLGPDNRPEEIGVHIESGKVIGYSRTRYIEAKEKRFTP